MKVEILNPDTVKNLYQNHGQFACVCYGTDEKRAERVGEACASSGHMSGSRCEYIKFRISDIDRGTAEQVMRHEIGMNTPDGYSDNWAFSDHAMQITDVSPDQIVKNMASFRYIDKHGFEYVTPETIQNCEKARLLYESAMKTIDIVREAIQRSLIEDGVSQKRAVQDANFVLPRATTSELVVGFTPEALIHFCHKRLCTRAQEFIRTLAKLIKTEIETVNPKFAAELVPHCEYLLWCPEGSACCGRRPTRAMLAHYDGEDGEK